MPKLTTRTDTPYYRLVAAVLARRESLSNPLLPLQAHALKAILTLVREELAALKPPTRPRRANAAAQERSTP